MLKIGCGAVSLLCLLAAAFVLWQTPGFPEALPSALADWALAWFKLFRNPVAAVALFGLCVGFAVAAASVTELLLGILFSLATVVLSLLCLVGALGATYKPFAETVENFFR
jgi:type III secretory pathway component EscS